MDDLEKWFKDNYPDDHSDPEPQWPEDYEEDEPPPKSDSDILGDTLRDNEQLKQQLAESQSNLQNMMDSIVVITAELQRYQDATPLLYKLLTDLDLDEYVVGEYELLLSGDIATEHDESLMQWTLRRIPPKV